MIKTRLKASGRAGGKMVLHRAELDRFVEALCTLGAEGVIPLETVSRYWQRRAAWRGRRLNRAARREKMLTPTIADLAPGVREVQWGPGLLPRVAGAHLGAVRARRDAARFSSLLHVPEPEPDGGPAKRYVESPLVVHCPDGSEALRVVGRWDRLSRSWTNATEEK